MADKGQAVQELPGCEMLWYNVGSSASRMEGWGALGKRSLSQNGVTKRCFNAFKSDG